jgi:hypothetical protein
MRASRALEVAQRRLAVRHAALSSARQRVETDGDPQAEVEFVGLAGSLPAMEARRERRGAPQGAFELGAAFEKRRLGLVFQEVDGGSVPASEGSRSTRSRSPGRDFLRSRDCR